MIKDKIHKIKNMKDDLQKIHVANNASLRESCKYQYGKFKKELDETFGANPEEPIDIVMLVTMVDKIVDMKLQELKND